ncbi:MAG: UDP-N-acetylmuramate dehydrogenase [Bacteroidaceae bacterium]|nr:UDP-N-acetylmuramate dehydrogenase [Bacteroidaceae bacterium]
MNHYSLLKHNTFGMDVYAKRFFDYSSIEELRSILKTIPADEAVLHIGGGSNLLFTHDYEGTILHSAIKGIEVIDSTDKDVLVKVGSGEVWDDFVAYCVQQNWGGVENLSLIPGEVGASAVQNIGAYGAEAKDVIETVEAIELRSGSCRTFSNAECNYAYRQSIFKKELKGQYAITHVTFRLSKTPTLQLDYGNIRAQLADKTDVTINDVRQAIISIREAKLPDPNVLGNAGSFFMNPIVSRDTFLSIQKDYPNMPFYETNGEYKIPAGWMIEQCGWKGKAQGRAAVHDKQALVLVNLGGATSDEIIALSDAICHDVKEKFGVDIHPEVNFI